MKHLRSAGLQAIQKYHAPPQLLVVILPADSVRLYQSVKHFGNITLGVATQCLKGNLARGSNPQYWANVCLKINAKLGGVNTKLNLFDSPSWIFDPSSPVMIIATHVRHPPPGTRGRPSFAGAVASLDSSIARFTALNTAQDSRVEMIQGLEGMVYELIGRYTWWKTNREKQAKSFPEKIIYYQNGVSGTQSACKRHGINPKITMVIAGGRRHVRFFPTHGKADQYGNCPAGTVVDDVVGSPQEFDFYLQSHSATSSTSRPSHYSVIHDENKFSQDGIQELTYALCHIHAGSTRSLSIPAPLRYAQWVSGGALNHYSPLNRYSDFNRDDVVSEDLGASSIQRYRELFMPVHNSMRYTM
ncbi:Protein argonaute-2 [Rhizoctonia solani]|uniref:Protein argonaute-2 n=1 Tax=Rhizoctonia solani TaxID=456999 RepID=A0A0K6FTN8_9AGAM|nr:Protein argonaute-2 [Rhizoctonia solani]